MAGSARLPLVGLALLSRLPTAAVAEVVEGVPQARRLAISVGEEDLDLPMCGLSKLGLEEDPVRRHCLRQCRVESDGRVRPTFSEWESYCRETAAMELWDGECEDYLACTFGCSIWGGERETFLGLGPADRYEYLLNTKADMYASGVTSEMRCMLEKCHSYCVRASLGSCRETQFRQQCLNGNPQLYGCDVDCNTASQARWTVAMMVLAFSLLRTA